METVDLLEIRSPPPAKKTKLDGGDYCEEGSRSGSGEGITTTSPDSESDYSRVRSLAYQSYPLGCPPSDDEEFEEELKTIKFQDIEKYNQQVKDSQGFDVDYFEGMHLVCSIAPSGDPMRFTKYAKLAIDHHNKGKDAHAHLTFANIVKVNLECCCYPTLYLTFEAQETNGGTRTYQARVVNIPGFGEGRGPQVELFRPKEN